MAEVGRPTDYRPEYDHMVEKMGQFGLTDAQMAEVLDVAMSTFSLWKTKHPSFSEANIRGKPGIDEQVQLSLLKRALGGFTLKEVVRDKEGKAIRTIEKEVAPDTPAALKWLFNRRPMEWRESRNDGPINPNANPLRIQFSDDPDLMDESKQDNLEVSHGTPDDE